MCVYSLHSHSGEYFLTGSSNGCVRIHPLSTPHVLMDLSSHWSLNMHDNLYGAVTSITCTFDDQYVLSGGEDGNVFIYKANLPTASQRAEAATIKVNKNLLDWHTSLLIVSIPLISFFCKCILKKKWCCVYWSQTTF